MSAICDNCGKPFDNGGEPFIITCDECLRAEGARLAEEAANFRNPTPPSIPVRARYYMTECEHCGWVGSSEQCGGGDEDIVCPVCCASIAGDEPSEADIAKHGEAVMQRILAAEARVEVLEQALRFYADPVNYRLNGVLNPGCSWFTGGDTAEKALAGLKEQGGGSAA